MAQHVALDFGVDVRAEEVGDWTIAVNSITRDLGFRLTAGDLAGQIDLIVHEELTVSQGSFSSVNLQNFTDLFGNTLCSFATLRAVLLNNVGVRELTVVDAGFGYPLPWCYGTDTGHTIEVGDFVLIASSASGYAINTNNKLVRFGCSAGTDDGTIEYVFAGVSS